MGREKTEVTIIYRCIICKNEEKHYGNLKMSIRCEKCGSTNLFGRFLGEKARI